MAVAPLFSPSLADLTSRLRLSGATQEDTLKAVSSAIQQARVDFYQSLGESRVTFILSDSYVDNPTSSSQILRLKAVLCETLLVKLYLLDELRFLAADSAADIEQRWNEEGLTRDIGSAQLRQLKDSIQSRVNILMGELSEDGSSGSFAAATIGPDIVPPKPNERLNGTYVPRYADDYEEGA